MKQAVFSLAVFLYLSAGAQQIAHSGLNKLPAYQPVKFETLKKFKSSMPADNVNSAATAPAFSFTITGTPAYSFKPLQNYLSEDISYFHLQQKTNEWTQFGSGALNSYYKKSWLENKNNVQQRWMVQKMKGR